MLCMASAFDCAQDSKQANDHEIWLQWPDFSGKASVAAARIDVSRQRAGAINPLRSDYRVAMWYFAGWPYDFGILDRLARYTPWRMPLLYDSKDPRTVVNGIQYYVDGDPRIMDWHVKWMAEHAVNALFVAWYPQVDAQGRIDATATVNAALDVGFLGKKGPGAEPVSSNRFEGLMKFAISWTNHRPWHKIPTDIGRYLAQNYFRQRNYFKIDGKPLLIVWQIADLIRGAGGRDEARQQLLRVREQARQEGFPDIYLASLSLRSAAPKSEEVEDIRALGFNGALGYWNYGTSDEQQTTTPMKYFGVWQDEDPASEGRDMVVHWEDYPTETVPGTEAGWEQWRTALGKEYLIATTPMQDWRGIGRPEVYVFSRVSPLAFEDQLRRARRHIEKYGLRKIVTIEAWNEWQEGSYVEPSIEYGYGWLEAIRRVFQLPEK